MWYEMVFWIISSGVIAVVLALLTSIARRMRNAILVIARAHQHNAAYRIIYDFVVAAEQRAKKLVGEDIPGKSDKDKKAYVTNLAHTALPMLSDDEIDTLIEAAVAAAQGIDTLFNKDLPPPSQAGTVTIVAASAGDSSKSSAAAAIVTTPSNNPSATTGVLVTQSSN